ncbi:L-threonylcarbamoyladenylate synthase [Anthocerotibacter panamensis]|uniref:L-threonylcarbamoyladenylate synthase n=1 Tax=Anthocerotibacter panamensis TaxID=2857077 RepID=UPI001C40823A|nr:L-threonylcarbamoyladenylate synthase [Anthocerotibacter panamensis]
MFCSQSEFQGRLRQGACGVFPTDTVPALGALPGNAQAIYPLKGRALDKPLILLAATVEQVRPLLAGWEADWHSVMTRFWPGALTLVLPANPTLPPLVQQRGMVGLRLPNQPEALQLLVETGPLATTSINRSGEAPLLDPATIAQRFPNLPLLYGEYQGVGVPSTVIRWDQTTRQWELLRLGAIPWPLPL